MAEHDDFVGASYRAESSPLAPSWGGVSGGGDAPVVSATDMGELLRKAFGASPVAMVISRLGDGRMVEVNEAFARLCGFERQELIGRTSVEVGLIHKDERREFFEVLIRGGRLKEREMLLRGKDGGARWVLASADRIEIGGEGCILWTGFEIGERKRVEEALRESEERLRLVLQGVCAGVWEVLLEPAALYWSPDYRDLYGFGAKEPASDEAWARSVHPEDLPRLREMVRMQLEQENGRGWRQEFRIQHPTLGERWIESLVRVRRDGAGRSVGFSGIDLDISERKKAEEALHESEERYRSLFKHMLDGFAHCRMIYENDSPKDFVYLSVNDSFERLTGLKNVVGKRVSEVIPDIHQSNPELLEIYGRVALSGQTERFETYVESLGIWFSISVYCPRKEHFVAVFDNITERKGAEEAVRQANQRLSYHVQNTPLAVIEFDAELRVCGWNDEAHRVFGWKPSEVMGKRMFDVPWLLPEDQPAIEQVAKGLFGGSTLRCVSPNRNVRKDGKVIWCEWYNSSLTDASGKMQSIQSLVLDVTASKEAEAVLTRDKAELERLVAERTAKLHELVGDLEHFSYTITHDLKSPLRAMRGFAEMMSMTCEGCGGTQAKEFLGRISTSAERMDRLIADALNYSRAVRQELPLEDVDSGALLRGMLDSYPDLQAEKARIVVEGGLPVVLANEAGLTQCFSNLLGNAVKFVRSGETPEVRVWASQREGWVRIWVEDKGIGISREMLSRVFDMFSRGSKNYDGTGIGLALVRKVVQRMGGRVGVESEEGEGSRFWIELKCGENRLAFAESPARQAESAREGIVLYVEDEESDALFMARAFEGKGLGGRLRLVADGRSAIEYLSGSGEFGDREKYPAPALVLLDLNLPQVPGFEVLEWIRNNPDYSRTPVILFSSSTRDDDQVRAKVLGADEFVTKPSSGLKFGEVVEGLQQKWLGRLCKRSDAALHRTL